MFCIVAIAGNIKKVSVRVATGMREPPGVKSEAVVLFTKSKIALCARNIQIRQSVPHIIISSGGSLDFSAEPTVRNVSNS